MSAKPEFCYVIGANQRSGTNMLCELLTDRHRRYPTEYFLAVDEEAMRTIALVHLTR